MERTRSRAKSKLWRGTNGYTIVEVMIFLAVSSGLLVAIMGTISGQQQRTQFITSTRDFENKLQDMVNDVQTGYYPNNGTTSCNVVGSVVSVPATAALQGTNKDCIYLGKAIRIVDPKGISDDPSSYYSEVTITGRRQNSGKDIKTISEAIPTAFDKNNNGEQTSLTAGSIDLTSIKYFRDGAQINESKAIAILNTIGSTDPVKAAQGRPSIAFIADNSIKMDKTTFRSAISSISDTSITDGGDGAVFCLREGNNGKVSAVTLGLRLDGTTVVSTGQQLQTQAYFDDDAVNLGCQNT